MLLDNKFFQRLFRVHQHQLLQQKQTVTPTPTLKTDSTGKVLPTLILTPTPTLIIESTIIPTLEQTQTKGGTEITNAPTKKPLPPTGNPSIITAGIIGAAIRWRWQSSFKS